MKITDQKNIKTKQIIELLTDESLDQSIEILANVFIVKSSPVPKLNILRTELASTINPKNITELILKDVREYGDTLGNTLARQGLVLLSWLEKEKK